LNSNDKKISLPRLYIPSNEKIVNPLSTGIKASNLSKKNTQKRINPQFYNQQHDLNNHFCVIVGSEYVLKIIALQQSLMQYSEKFTLWICCIDPFAYSLLKEMSLTNVNLLQVEELEDRELKAIKRKRKVNEYCWTLKSVLIEYLLVNYDLPSILYCDGDLCFFSDPNIIFEEWGDHSIFLTPQRDRDWVEKMYGKYQAGLIGFKNDLYGLKSVRWWKNKCIDWCSAEAEEGKFGDQKYLDYIPIYFPKVKISNNLGINAAPWNCIYNNDYKIDKTKNDIFIENDKLVVYHFACITIFTENDFDLWSLGEISIPNNILNHIYTPYLERIQFVLKQLKDKFNKDTKQFLSKKDINKAQTLYKDSQLRRKMNQSNHFMNFSMIISKERLIQGLTSYYSLENFNAKFTVWICCMDDLTYQILEKLKLKHAILIPVKEIENHELLSIKNDRSLQEYCWTLKAPLCLHVLSLYPEVDHIIYCDADMYFFTAPNIILDEWWKYSVFLCPQRSSTEIESIHGIYQAGLVGFKNDQNSKEILTWWKDKCLEYCNNHYDVEMDRWGDQKYLNHIPNIFSNIKIMTHRGIDAAPWNVILNSSSISKTDNKVFIDQDELIAFHFGSMQIINPNEFDLWKQETLELPPAVLNYIYIPYIEQLNKTCHTLHNTFQKSPSSLFADQIDTTTIKNYFKYPSPHHN